MTKKNKNCFSGTLLLAQMTIFVTHFHAKISVLATYFDYFHAIYATLNDYIYFDSGYVGLIGPGNEVLHKFFNNLSKK